MADDVDQAQAREESDREAALAAHAARVAASFAPADPTLAGRCMDCDEPIEAARLKALRGAASRCIECARAYEHLMRDEQAGRR